MTRKLLLLLFLVPMLALGVTCRKDEPDPAGLSRATLAFTDAATDDLSVFEVDIASVVFHKYSGATVSVLTKATRVDFTQLEDFGELIVGVGLESGYYTGMTLTLDFTDATVLLKGETDEAALFDADGQPLTGTMDVDVSFSAGDRPYVTADRNHLFLLDLCLDQAVTADTSLNQVTFVPILSAQVDPADPKPILATGYLLSVDTAASSFEVQKRTDADEVVGSFTTVTDAATVYQIDGVGYTGAAGLTALAALPADTRVWMRGTVDADAVALHAGVVEAGAGTFGSGQDWIEGLVVARDQGAGLDCSLTVLGRSRDLTTGTRTYNTAHAVNVSHASTKVCRRGAASALDTDSINVGQRVLVFGEIAGLTMDATATTAVVRMVRTGVYGYAAGPASGNTLTVDAVRFGLRPHTAFDFNVGGTAEASPGAYAVDVTGLDTSGIVAGSRVRILGWANPVGVASDDDFTALSVIDRGADARLLLCGWIPPEPGAVASATAAAVTLDISGADWHVVDDGFAGQEDLTGTPAASVVPKHSWGIYLIFENGGVTVHYDFAAFADSLNARISPTARVARVAALGSFETATQVFSAGVVSVVLK